MTGIVALMAAASVPTLRTIWQYERVTAVANEFATWLEQMKAISMRNDAPLTVCITTANNASGAALATATPNDLNCPPTGLGTTFHIPEMPAGAFTIAMIPDSAPTTFTYTPRGATTNSIPVEVSFAALNQDPLRCVQVSAILGQVRVGRMNQAACITD